MKVLVNFGGIPILFRTLRKKEFEFEFCGCTVRDLVDEFVRQYGEPFKKAVLDDNGDVDIEIRILHNDSYVMGDRMGTSLEEGDFLAFRGACLG
jgi:23S rRNA G2445 N2-methylase RlmL